MPEIDLTIIPSEETPKEEVSLKAEKKPKPKTYEIEEAELSKNIRKFDWKVKHPKVYTENPYGYNQVSFKKNVRPIPPVQTASQMIVNPVYNAVGKFLGVDTIHDWNRDYEKVYTITEWARSEGMEKPAQIMRWLSSRAKRIPSIGQKTIDNLYLFAHMRLTRK